MGREERAKTKPATGQKHKLSTSDPDDVKRNKSGGCPDFDLAPLERFPPEVLGHTGDDDVDAFILSLALAFNDMKGVQWMMIQLDNCTPSDQTKPTAEFGQWAGMRLQATRLTVLTLHEVLVAIEAAQDQKLLDRPRFVEAVARLGRPSRADWQELLALANTEKGDPLRNYIIRVRNNLSAHYYQPKELLRGYRTFFEAERTVFNEHALASFGIRVEHTRFYFADAAAQAGQALLDEKNALFNEVRPYVLGMFGAIRFLIEKYLALRTTELAKKSTKADFH